MEVCIVCTSMTCKMCWVWISHVMNNDINLNFSVTLVTQVKVPTERERDRGRGYQWLNVDAVQERTCVFALC